MSKNYNPVRATESEYVDHFVRMLGGAAAVTKVFGNGITVTYSATGVYKVSWNESPGVFLGCTFGFQATSATALKGYTATCPAALTANTDGTYSILVSVWNSSFAAADLAAAQWLTVVFAFKETAV